MNADQIAFQEKFKDQMQTMGKNGILGTLNSNRNYNNNGANCPVKIIHHTAYENNPPHRKNLLKPIKPQTPSVANANDTTTKTDTTIQQDCTNMTNNPYISQHTKSLKKRLKNKQKPTTFLQVKSTTFLQASSMS